MDGTRRGELQLRALSKDGFVPGLATQERELHGIWQEALVRTDGHPATLRR